MPAHELPPVTVSAQVVTTDSGIRIILDVSAAPPSLALAVAAAYLLHADQPQPVPEPSYGTTLGNWTASGGDHPSGPDGEPIPLDYVWRGRWEPSF